MYGEIVTRLRYKPVELKNTTLTINGTKALLSIDPPEIPFPVLSAYEYCTIFLESFETNKDTLYEVKYEIHYKWNELLYKIGEVTSVDGKAEFPRLIKGMSYYVTAIPLDGKYQSKQVRITLDEYDIRQEPVAITTYENSDYKNYDHHMILKNIFGDANVYLEGNPDYISLDRNDKNLRVYLNKDATERASEFDLVIEDYRIEDIIVSRKIISVNDGFSSPYDISIEFTDSNAAIFRWKTDGEYSINKFYISNSINDKEIPTVVIDTSTYIITNFDNSKTHYLWISSIRDGKEKISDPVTIDAFDKSINPLIGPLVNYSINQNNDLVVYLNHNSTTVDNYSVYLEENEITSIDGLTPIVTSTSKNIVIPNFDVYNNYDRTLKVLATTNKYNHSYLGDNKDIYVAYDWTPDNLNCDIYLDANDITTATTTTWKDRKTNAVYNTNNASLSVNTINNNKAIYFNYTSILYCLDTKITDLIKNVSNPSAFIVWNKTIDYTDSNDKCIFRFTFADGSNRFTIYSNIYNTNKYGLGGRKVSTNSFVGIDSIELAAKNKIYMTCNEMNINNDYIKLYTDGLLTKQSPLGFGSGTSSNEEGYSNIGGYTTNVGGANGGGHVGNIFCIIYNKNGFTTEERQKLEGWAAHKYGLTDNLPSDHPYKTKRPVIDHTPYNLTAEFKND